MPAAIEMTLAWQRPVRRLRLALRRRWVSHPTYWVEAIGAVTTLGWAAHVWWMQGDLIDRPGYVQLARWAPDWLWCLVGAVGAPAQLLCLWAESRPARALAALGMCGYWLLLADGLHRAVPGSPSVTPYLGLALANAVALLRLAQRP